MPYIAPVTLSSAQGLNSDDSQRIMVTVRVTGYIACVIVLCCAHALHAWGATAGGHTCRYHETKTSTGIVHVGVCVSTKCEYFGGQNLVLLATCFANL